MHRTIHRNKWIKIFALLVVISVVLMGCGPEKPQETAPVEKEIPVTVEAVVRGNMEKSIPLGGLMSPREEVVLVSKNPAAKIIDAPVEVGDMVGAGTPVVIFDSRDLDIKLNQAQLDYQRTKDLFDLGAVPQSQMEQVENALENVKIQKENMVLTSPITGVVSSVSAVEGQLAGSTPLVTVVDINRLELELQVGEAYIKGLKEGQEMQVTIPAVTEKEFTGVITNIAPQIDIRTKAYPVTVEIDNYDQAVKGGMYGEVQLVVDRKEDVIVIPQYAVIDTEQGAAVFVVEEGQAKMKMVEVGLTLGNQAEITAGLKENEVLIVEGQYAVKDGTLVSPTLRGEEE